MDIFFDRVRHNVKNSIATIMHSKGFHLNKVIYLLVMFSIISKHGVMPGSCSCISECGRPRPANGTNSSSQPRSDFGPPPHIRCPRLGIHLALHCTPERYFSASLTQDVEKGCNPIVPSKIIKVYRRHTLRSAKSLSQPWNS